MIEINQLRLIATQPRAAQSRHWMRYHAASRSCILGVVVLFVGCASLPSVDNVEHSFRREHPTFEILRVTSRVDVSDDAHRHSGNAVFDVIYRQPGGSKLFALERKFGTVAEGWIEGPSSTTEVP
ncbi:MAG TPA: hypothetical protein VIY68_06765 [Steroidobacteraceae bacterium]